MAYFYGAIQAHGPQIDLNLRGSTRCGRKSTGLAGLVTGWTAGIEVTAERVDGHDVFRIYATNGSQNGSQRTAMIGSYSGTTGFIPAVVPPTKP